MYLSLQKVTLFNRILGKWIFAQIDGENESRDTMPIERINGAWTNKGTLTDEKVENSGIDKDVYQVLRTPKKRCNVMKDHKSAIAKLWNECRTEKRENAKLNWNEAVQIIAFIIKLTINFQIKHIASYH